MLFKRVMLLTLLLLRFVSNILSQSIDTLLARYDEQAPQEKIYIQFDNNAYTPGQTIWFKAYISATVDILYLSKNFYLDWYDANGKLINHQVWPILYSSASGNFDIPAGYSGEQVQVVAYTKWMLNFDSAFFYRKQLNVVQNQKRLHDAKVGSVTTIQFLPEGGDAVENIPAVFAFKAVNQAGLPVEVNGVIKNKTGNSVTTFVNVHDGMGKLQFTPVPGELYTAEWKDATGVVHNTSLPAAKASGITLHFESGTLNRVFHIERSANVPESLKKINIVAQINQQVVFTAIANLSVKEKITSKIPVNGISSGILQVTLFDVNWQPVAERLLFINKEEYLLNTNLNLDTLNLGKRGKNVFEIEVDDSIPSNLSVAVTDGGLAQDSSNHIISQLLLAGDIKGHVHNPAYYFSKDNDSVAEHLDLVMMTNGWRRFKWEDVLQKKIPAIHFEKDTSYLSITGKIEKIADAKLKKAEVINLILQAKDSSRQFMFLPLRPDGSFSQSNLILFDTTKIFYKINGMKFMPGRSSLSIHNNFVTPVTGKTLRPTAMVDSSGSARITFITEEQLRAEEQVKKATLKEVTVYSRPKSKLQILDEKYTFGLFSKGESYQFGPLGKTDPGAEQSVLGYLLGRVPGLEVDINPSKPKATFHGVGVSLFIDEVPSDGINMASVYMSDVAYMKVFRPPFLGPGGGSGGAIAVYTKKGGDDSGSVEGLSYLLLPGYSPVKQFYSPNYAEQQAAFTTDLRTTIFWKPYIVTDSLNRKVRFSFYNNDISHSLRVIIQGMNSEGRMVYINKLLQ